MVILDKIIMETFINTWFWIYILFFIDLFVNKIHVQPKKYSLNG